MREWHKGRSSYCVWMYRFTDQKLLSFTEAIHERLAKVGCVIPVKNLHMTIFVAGFKTREIFYNDDVLFSTLDEQLARLSATRFSCPEVVVTGLKVARSAILLECRDLTKNTTRVRDVLGADCAEIRFSPFYPHITLGHFQEPVMLGEVVSALDPWITLQTPITINQHALELVEIEATRPVNAMIGLCADDFSRVHVHRFAERVESSPRDSRVTKVGSFAY